MEFLTDIFKRVTEKLNGIDFCIVAVGVVVCAVAWKWISAKKADVKKLRQQLIFCSVVITLAIMVISINRWLQSHKKFETNVAGVLVLRIEGDTKDNSLQRRLVSAFDAEFAKDKSGEQIEVWACDESANERDGILRGHEAARKIGDSHNALLVVWGNTDEAKRFFPRMTLIKPTHTYNVHADRTYQVQDIREINFSKETLSQAVFLSHFIAGWTFGSRGQYKSAIEQFDATIAMGDAAADDFAYAKLFRALCKYRFSLNKQKYATALNSAIVDLQNASAIFEAHGARYEWAECQTLMSFCLAELPTGNIVDNQKRAFECYTNASSILTKSEFPEMWGTTRLLLCELWGVSITGFEADNNFRQKAALDEAFEVFTKTKYPGQWSIAEDILGLNYMRAHEHEPNSAEWARLAKACFERALSVLDPQSDRTLSFMEQQHLAIALMEEDKADKLSNHQKSIAVCEKILRECDPTNEAVVWAAAHHNMGLVYAELDTTNKDENLRQAILHFEKALEVRSPEDLPYARVDSLNNMGSCYVALSDHNVGNIKKALSCFEESIKIVDEKSCPTLWAETQGTLGLFLMNITQPDRKKVLLASRECLRNALKVFKKDRFPDRFWKVRAGLAFVETELDQLDDPKQKL